MAAPGTLELTLRDAASAVAGCAVIQGTSADNRVEAVLPDGTTHILSQPREGNILANGGFHFAQRQAPGTLTTYSSTSGRVWAADRFFLSNENASVQYQRGDQANTPESGLTARHYATLKKITNAGKILMGQSITCSQSVALRGQKVRWQLKAKNSVGTHTLRIGLLQLTSAGTIDTIPGTFISAWNSNGTDPTFGTNLSLVVPSRASQWSSVNGSVVNATLNGAWRRYGGGWTVPTDCKNLLPCVWVDSQMAANDVVMIAECALYLGDSEREYVEPAFADELQRCQRFCWKSFEIDAQPVAGGGIDSSEIRAWATNISAGAVLQLLGQRDLPVPMFKVPTATTYNPAIASNAEARNSVRNETCSSLTITPYARTFSAVCTGSASTVYPDVIRYHIMLEAEL